MPNRGTEGVPKYLYVTVEPKEGKKAERVNIRVPFSLFRAGIKFASLIPEEAQEKVSSAMQGGLEVGIAEGLDKKLNIAPPLPIEHVLTVLPPLKPLSEIKSSLKKLIKKAYSIQPKEILVVFDQNQTECIERESELGYPNTGN